MQAIVTKYHGPTNFRGSRVSAKASAGRISIPWDYAKDVEQNHDAAALAFCRKFAWTGALACGELPKGDGNVYVFVTHSFRRVGNLRVVR